MDWADIGKIALLVILGSLGLALLLLLLAYRKLKNLKVPPQADLFTTLRHVPLVLVIILDLLDMALDVFAAPFSWFLLHQLGLDALKGVTVIEGIIPGTQLIPTLTAAWVLARLGFRMPGQQIEGYRPPPRPREP